MDFPITTGIFPVAVLLAGVAALIVLLYGRTASWWCRRVPIAVSAGVAATALVTLLTDHVLHPFADHLPRVVVVWIGLTFAGLALAFAKRAVRIRVIGVALTALIAFCGAVQVNAGFGAYPTIRAALGLPVANQVDAGQVLARTHPATPKADGQVLTSTRATASTVPAHGAVTTAPIPGVVSGFSARDSWIYLPPAYEATPRPLLPVLILLSGQPGEPRNWFDGGSVAQTMDAYAHAHLGLAPVVVVPDWLGDSANNPLCVDSAAAGNDFTYLTVDVPNWINSNLQVDASPMRRAVGGLSSGGTCAVQLAVNAPQIYPTFLCFSGQEEPTLSTRADTVAALFHGDEAAFRAINPIDVLALKRFPQSAGFFVAGSADTDYGPQTRTVFGAAKAAGMDVQYKELPGGHTFLLWSAALAASADWLGTRLKIAG